ncbi:hypothetical protein PGS49_21500 [Yersinia intermedia]|uniref:hypothetical protein n=1 Tax=Yersinia intermedia TaxID=631 RepID=UPI0022FDCFDE|nr:hypothetical protein [Yersinia intermedia]MDA5483195.1 hypothetical protein [Yersinia intermedia]
MEHLSEVGKRVERLLYSSVIIILASFFFYFLSSAITSDNNSLKKTILTNFIESINTSRESLDVAKVLQETYKQYVDDNKKKTEKQKKEEEDKKRLEIKNINKARIKLGLSEINIDKNLEEKPSSYDGLDIENINLIRNKLGLKSSSSIEGAKDIYNEIYFSLVHRNLYGNSEFIKIYRSTVDLPINEVIKDAKNRIKDFDNGSVKVFDVDTPIQIPFSLGDMKSKVSLYNIESAGMIFMPVLLVIWIGSISMTRIRELYYIKKTKNIAQSYPHILNIYYFIDRDMLDGQKEIDSFNRMRIGDTTIIKENRSISVAFFLFRVLMLLALLLLMMVPFYMGAYRIMGSLDTLNLIILFMCFITNIIQSAALVFAEFSVFGKIFLTEGQTNEFI